MAIPSTPAAAETELRKLVAQSQPYLGKQIAQLHSTVLEGWLHEEQKIANKLYTQIDRICRLHGPALDAKLFNESRDCIQKLEEYIFKLKDARYNMQYIPKY